MITKEVYEEEKALSNRWKEMYYEKKNELDQLTNNWNELEEYINKEKYQDTWGDSVILVGYLLDKMKEIKDGNNDIS